MPIKDMKHKKALGSPFGTIGLLLKRSALRKMIQQLVDWAERAKPNVQGDYLHFSAAIHYWKIGPDALGFGKRNEKTKF